MSFFIGLILGIILGWMLPSYLPSAYVERVNQTVASFQSILTGVAAALVKLKEKLPIGGGAKDTTTSL